MTETIYAVVAVVGAFLAIYVMQKTEHDQINMVDAIWVQWLRRAAFTLVSCLLLYSVINKNDMVMLLLVTGGVGNLAINAVALHRRSSPPQDRFGEGAKVQIASKVNKSSQWRITAGWPAE